jgi:hypothetical protein
MGAQWLPAGRDCTSPPGTIGVIARLGSDARFYSFRLSQISSARVRLERETASVFARLTEGLPQNDSRRARWPLA